MDGCSAKKSTSLETLVIQNISNVNDLKAKLNDIIKTGKDYDYDVSSCIKQLLNSSDQEIVLLSVQAVSELVKCEEKRETYAQKDVIKPILQVMKKEGDSDKKELIKQCCRSLGNLCCDCDTARKIILENNGVPVLIKLLDRSLSDSDEIKLLVCKALLNFAIGGQECCEAIIENGIENILCNILTVELEKDDMNDDMVTTTLVLFSVINDNNIEIQFCTEVNIAVLNILEQTANVEISELCLDHLHTQAEHDAVKTLLANEHGVQLVCSRLEQLLKKHEAGDLNSDDSIVEAIIKQACDLVIIVLIGDDAMHILYNKGLGEVYHTMVRWLESTNYNLLSTAVLAIGNFARQDDYCTQMMDLKIYDKLLDIFETYHGFAVRMQKEPDATHPIDAITLNRIQHGVLSALRNLSVPAANKRVLAAQGRAAPVVLAALPNIEDHHVAYKLLATVRMLVDGQEGVAKLLASDAAALSSVARWGHAGEYAGAAGEAPRLLAWTVKQLRHNYHWRHIVEADGCISCLVNMLVASHSVMQNEAILALTLLAIECLTKSSNTPDADQPTFDYEKSFITQLVKSEIGKHVSVLVDTNCAKIPTEVAENLLAFLDITSKRKAVASDYKETKVQDILKRFSDTRSDLSDDFKACISAVVAAISDSGKEV